MRVGTVERICAFIALVALVIFVTGSALADPSQTLSISDTSVSEGGTMTFTVSLSAGPDEATVNWATSAGSATADVDYTESNGSVTVQQDSTATISVPTTQDPLDESNENFTVTLSGEVGAVLGDGSATGTITDDDAAPGVAITGPPSVNEDAGTATYNVAITGQSASTVSVNYATANGSAVAPGDYTTTSGQLSWPTGDTGAKSFTVPIVDDALDEDPESFSVNLSGANGGQITDGNQSTTINDDDNQPTTGVFADVATTEGNGSGSHEVNFTVNLDAASGKAVTINYSTVDGSATAADNDYEPEVNQNLVIPAGQTTGTIGITVNHDGAPEANETFTVNLNSATNATRGADTQATGTISNDDSGVTASINDMTVTEGNAGTVNATFTISLSAGAPTASTVTWRTANGTAVAPDDYTAVPNTVANFAQGATSAQVTVVVKGDTAPEPNETFFVDLVASSGSVSISADSRGTGTITNDDSNSTASINDVAVTEGASPNTVNATFTVSFSPATPGAGTITWRTANGSAITPDDYTGVGNTSVSIPSGATSATITVQVKGDGLPESNENFFVDLVGSTGPITIGADSRGTGTINDDDSTPTASINDVTVTEGASPNTVNAVFTVSLSSAAPAAITIQHRTVNGSAIAPDDYTAIPAGTNLSIAQGATSGTITVVVKGDALPEGTSENFFVDLTGSTGPVSIGADNRGTGTITDDDATPSASINNAPAVTEGQTGTKNATFTVTLTSAAASPVQIAYRTVDSSAVAPGDYTAIPSGTVTIGQGQTTGTINVVVNADTLPEGTGTPPAEQFFVDLVNVSSGPATIGSPSRGTGTITDDDSPVTASINDPSIGEGHTGTKPLTFTIALSGPAQAPVTIRYRTTDGSATSPSDYTGTSAGGTTLTIPQGQSSGTFPIPVKGDVVPEGTGNPLAEQFFVDLITVVSGPATINSDDSRGIGSIVDDDSPVTASINDVSVTEGNSGTRHASFTVTLSGAASAPVTITLRTTDGSATAPDDYVAVQSAQVQFAESAFTAQFDVVVNGDTVYEGDHAFFVDLISVSGPATISEDFRGQATIIEDDPAPPPPPGGGGGGGGGNIASLPSLTIDDPSTTEGTPATFTLTLNGSNTRTVTVRVSTVSATAIAGTDFTAKDEVVTFAAGERTKTVSVATINDTAPESVESFWLRLTQPANATIGKALGIASIDPSDQPKPEVPLPRMVIGPRTLSANKNAVVMVKVSCLRTSPIPCAGRLQLETSTVTPKFTLGVKGFSMQRGKTVTLYIKLPARGVNLLLKTGSTRTRAIVFVKDGNKKLRRFVAGFLPLKASTALAAKHGQAKTLVVNNAETKTTKPKPKPKPAPPPQIIVGP